MKNYHQLALRTEKTDYEGKVYSKELWETIPEMAIQTAQLLDIYKKHFFYNRHYDQNVLTQKIAEIRKTLDILEKHNLEQVLNKSIPENDKKTFEKSDEESIRLLHMVLGVVTEGGEIAEALDKNHKGEQLDWVNIAEELGDIFWYTAIPLNILESKGVFNITEETIKTRNIEKLAKRYGDKFSDYLANNRDLEAERKILEG